MAEGQTIRENKIARGLGPDESVCVAPSTSIYFHYDGTAMACCGNKQQVLGRYPENTLDEIWGGAERTRLQEYLDKDIFPDGCWGCAESVKSSNHTGMLAACFDQYRHSMRTSGGSPGPLSMSFELGTVCNFECVMCSGEKSSSIRKNREKRPWIPSPYDDEFVRQLRPFIPGLQVARFFGGEPFLNRLNFKVWDLIAELNPSVRVSITTNGSVLSDRIKNVIRTLKPRLEVSLESLVPGNYEAIRINGNLNTVRSNLDWLMENNALNSITVCPLRTNWRDIPEIVSYCCSRQISVYFNTVLEPVEHSLRFMSRTELDEVAQYLSSAKFPKSAASTDARNHRIYGDLVNQITAWRDSSPAP